MKFRQLTPKKFHLILIRRQSTFILHTFNSALMKKHICVRSFVQGKNKRMYVYSFIIHI